MAAKPNGNTPTFDCPSWAGMPPAGLHLDVVKGDKLVEKLIIDEKKYYLFGRNPDVCDFTVDHQSCSRIHSALVYHKHLRRAFIIDLNSTHGTFLGRIRLEPHKPQQVPLDSTMSFGASTRVYILREKPQSQGCVVPGEMKTGKDEELKGLLGLPEAEMELDNLTEFNTAHNKRLSTLTIEEGDLDIHRPKRRRRRRRRRRSSHVSFSDEEEVINPEDVDPFVGRFRNLIQAAVVPIKGFVHNVTNVQWMALSDKHDTPSSRGLDAAVRRRPSLSVSGSLYGDLPLTGPGGSTPPTPLQAAASITGGLPLHLPQVDVSLTSVQTPVTLNPGPAPGPYTVEPLDEPHKKKYAKEAWPEKRPTLSLLV